jgi:hypothetical protein
MKLTKSYLRKLIKEEILKELSASDIDMEDLALVYDEEYGPDYVAGIMADEFPSLDNDAAYEKLLGMLKEAARRGEEDYPLNFLANRIAELGAMKENKMKITESQIRQVVKKILLKEFGSEEYGRQTKEFEPVPGVDFDNPKEAALRQIVADKERGKVGGTMVDLFTASAIVSVLDAVNETNKEKLLALPVDRMATIAFNMMKK